MSETIIVRFANTENDAQNRLIRMRLKTDPRPCALIWPFLPVIEKYQIFKGLT